MNTSEAKHIMQQFGEGLTIEQARKMFGDDFYALIISAAYQTGTYLDEDETGIWKRKTDGEVFKGKAGASDSDKKADFKQLDTLCSCGKSYFVVLRGQGYVCNVCDKKRA